MPFFLLLFQEVGDIHGQEYTLLDIVRSTREEIESRSLDRKAQALDSLRGEEHYNSGALLREAELHQEARDHNTVSLQSPNRLACYVPRDPYRCS